MTSVLLPSSPGVVVARPRLLDWGGVQTSVLGGTSQRIERLGSRHALDVELPPMDALTAMAWIQRLKRGKSLMVRMVMPQPGFTPAAQGAPRILTAGGGGAIDIAGLVSGWTGKEGQFASISTGGRLYLYALDADVAAAATAFTTYTNTANTTITAQGSNVYRIEKTGGGAAWDAGAYASPAARGDFLLRVKPAQTNKYGHFGMNADPTTSASDTDIDRSILFEPGGVITFWENGVATPPTLIGTYTSSDYLFLRRQSGVITVLKGTTTSIGAATLLHTATPSSNAVSFDCSLFSSGGIFDVYLEDYRATAAGVTPLLRKNAAIGDAVELVAPMIEGFPEGDETGWTVDAAAHYGLAFSIVEAA